MKVMKALLAVLIGFIAVTVLVLELVHDKKKRKVVIGTLCAVFAVGMYVSPLTVMVSSSNTLIYRVKEGNVGHFNMYLHGTCPFSTWLWKITNP